MVWDMLSWPEHQSVELGRYTAVAGLPLPVSIEAFVSIKIIEQGIVS
jgi:hypothetical protein